MKGVFVLDISSIFTIFDSVGDWVITTVPKFLVLFYDSASNELTLLGALAVAGLAFSVIFLLIGLIQRFLHFRG